MRLRRRAGWFLLVLLGSALALWLLAWRWLPGALVPRIETALGEVLGRPVRIEALDASPSLMEWQLRGLRIGGRRAQDAPLFTLDLARAELSLSTLRFAAPVLQALHLQAPRLRLRRLADGSTDLDDIVSSLQSRPASSGEPPARFAVFNLVIDDASVSLRDDVSQADHALHGLTLRLPFLSNLPVHLKVAVEPKAAFVLDGAAFEASGSALPFEERRPGRLRLSVPDLDAAPWLAYWPRTLPIRPTQARLGIDLTLDFEQPARADPRWVIQGRTELRDVRIVDAKGAALGAWRRLALDWSNLQPLARQAELASLALDGLQIELRRRGDGELDLPWAPQADAASGSSAPEWKLALARMQLSDGRLRWSDDSVQPAPVLTLQDFELEGQALSWPAAQPLRLRYSARLGQEGAAGPARLTGSVEGDGRQWAISADLAAAQLDWAAPYLRTYTSARLRGRLDAGLEIRLSDVGAPGIHLRQARVTDLSVQAPAPSSARPLALRSFEVQRAELDLAQRQARIGQLRVSSPALALAREADGSWNVQSLLAPAGGVRTQGVAASGSGAPWSLVLQDLSVNDGTLSLRDAAVAAPVAIQASAFRLRARDLRWPLQDGLAAPIELGFSLVATEHPDATGSLSFSGRWRGLPMGIEGRADIEALPLAWAAGYTPSPGPFRLADARLRFRGDVAVDETDRGLQWRARGDAALTSLDLRSTVAGAGSDELLNWQSLSARGLALGQAAGEPLRLQAEELRLSDFFARLLVDERGRLNLQAGDASADASGASTGPPSAPASASAAAATPAASAGAAPAASSPAPTLLAAIGSTRLINGRVSFTDRFIRPNYSAALSELNGSLGSFSSETAELAALELRGRAEGTALLDIAGTLHPMTRPPSLELRARATDLELAPLSPYAAKYAGYGIESGKLSMDVRYRIDPDGRLDASNRIVLNQLTFGERVESPDATRLPVLLAVALLKDRNGVIDIDLPIGGSLQDPQFSVGGLIVKVIVNLLGKALTAPFSLLGGSGPDPSQLAFVAGTSRLAEGGEATLQRVGQALQDRPSLQLTITGHAALEPERAALQAAMLEAQIAAAHRRSQQRAAPDGAASPPSSAQREAVLRQLYRDAAHLPERPRNALGLLRDMPPSQMEAMLRNAVAVTPDSIRELALQRSVAVRDALVAQGLPVARLFLAAPKVAAPGEEAIAARATLALGVP